MCTNGISVLVEKETKAGRKYRTSVSNVYSDDSLGS